MIITLGGYTLCDGPDRSVNKSAGPSDFTLVGNLDAQTSKPLRAVNATCFNRGNRVTEVSFTVRRLHASVSAALLWAVQHPVTVTRSGTLVLTGGGQLLTAVLDRISIRHVGVTVFADYHITGGKLEQIP